MKHLGPDSSVTNLCGLYPSHCFKYHLNLCIMVCANTFSFRPCVHVQLTRAFSCSSQNTTKEAHKSSLSDALTLTFGTKIKLFTSARYSETTIVFVTGNDTWYQLCILLKPWDWIAKYEYENRYCSLWIIENNCLELIKEYRSCKRGGPFDRKNNNYKCI